jgi:RHS repeat-associated protein
MGLLVLDYQWWVEEKFLTRVSLCHQLARQHRPTTIACRRAYMSPFKFLHERAMIPWRHVKVIARWSATDLIVLRLFCILYLIRAWQFLLFQKFATEFFDSLTEPATDCHNHLGSGALVTDSAGNEVFRITYTEYGEIDLVNSGKYNPATGEIEHHLDAALIAITAVKYTGQEYDPETGFYYYNARYYDPQLGVFTTADTEFDVNAGNFAFNRHMYVAGNPIMATDPSGHFINFEKMIDDVGMWWDKNIGNPIRKEIGNDAFNVLAGLATGAVPGLDIYKDYKAGGLGNVLLGEVGKGTTGALNIAGCFGCSAAFSYTYAEGFGFNIGWGPTMGFGGNVGLMYRERGVLAGMNGIFGISAGIGTYGRASVNFLFNMDNGASGMFASLGAGDQNLSAAVGFGRICTQAGCSHSFSGYSAVDYGAIGVGLWNTRDEYMTGGTTPQDAHRPQSISHGQEGDFLTFGPDFKTGWKSVLLGERGALGLLGQLAGGKPTSVMHDAIVVKLSSIGNWQQKTFWQKVGGVTEFVSTMPASYAIAQPLARIIHEKMM